MFSFQRTQFWVCRSLFEDHHGHPIVSVIRQAQMNTPNAVVPADLGGDPPELQTGFTRLIVEDLDIPPPYTLSHTETQGLGKGLFGGETKSKGRRWKHTAIAKFLLIRCKDPVDKTVSPSINNSTHSLDLYEICTKTINHFNLLNGVHLLMVSK